MRIFRRLPTRRLLAVTILAIAVAVAATAGAVTALGGSGPKPPAKELAQAVHDALAAPTPAGVTARIRFTNHLLADGALGDVGGSALLAGASGRLWATADGHVRLELQSDAGDTQIVSDGTTLSVYDASSGTVYRVDLPRHAAGTPDQPHQAPTVAGIQAVLDRLAGHLVLSGAQPDSVAGRSAYTLRVSPKEPAGLLGAAELSWDALAGVPLRFAVYATGSSSPVLELTATDISFGPVSPGDVAVSPPASAKVVDLGAPGTGHADKAGAGSGTRKAPVTGRAAVQAALPFTLAAPATLGGLPLAQVRSVTVRGTAGALVLYGHGLAGTAVLETAATGKDTLGKNLPTVSVNGAKGVQLETALGGLVRFETGGVTYLVVASQPAATVLAAARELVP